MFYTLLFVYKTKGTSFSLNCQSLKWVKTQYAYSELLAVELISSSSNDSSYCCTPSSPSWYPRIHPRRAFKCFTGTGLLPIYHITGKTGDFPIYPGNSTGQTSIKYSLGVFCGVFPKNTPIIAHGHIYGWASVRGFPVSVIPVLTRRE